MESWEGLACCTGNVRLVQDIRYCSPGCGSQQISQMIRVLITSNSQCSVKTGYASFLWKDNPWCLRFLVSLNIYGHKDIHAPKIALNKFNEFIDNKERTYKFRMEVLEGWNDLDRRVGSEFNQSTVHTQVKFFIKRHKN